MPEKTWQVKWKANKSVKGAGIPCWMLCAATNICTKGKDHGGAFLLLHGLFL